MTYQELEQSVIDLQDQATALEDRIISLEGQADRRQLEFPADTTTESIIKEIFKYGTVALIGGTATVNNSFCSASSTIIFAVIQTAGTPGTVTITAQGNGVFTFTSTSATDTSTLAWFMIP